MQDSRQPTLQSFRDTSLLVMVRIICHEQYYLCIDEGWFEKLVFTGARRDEDGYIWITGRVDDMLNVSGHLLSTAQVESALIEHKAVVESAVVGAHHNVKGEVAYCFVTLRDGFEFSDKLVNELKLQGKKKKRSWSKLVLKTIQWTPKKYQPQKIIFNSAREDWGICDAGSRPIGSCSPKNTLWENHATSLTKNCRWWWRFRLVAYEFSMLFLINSLI